MEKVKNMYVINDKWIIELLTKQQHGVVDSDSATHALVARYPVKKDIPLG